MKSRRGSLWGTDMGGGGMVSQYAPGDIVKPVAVADVGFIGVVRDVDPRINKVWVAWGGGSAKQHDPDEIMLVPVQDSTVRSKMASIKGRRTRNSAEGSPVPHGDDFVGNPKKHGIDAPRGGGFSIMQDLQKDLHKESVKSAAAGKKDKFGRVWDLPKEELCPVCGQPDSTGDCNHKKLSDREVGELKSAADQDGTGPEGTGPKGRGEGPCKKAGRRGTGFFAASGMDEEVRSRRAASPVSIMVELGGQQGHYVVDGGYRTYSIRELPGTIVKALKARIMRSMAGMFGPEMTGIELDDPDTRTMSVLQDTLAKWSKALVMFDPDVDRYTVGVSSFIKSRKTGSRRGSRTECPECLAGAAREAAVAPERLAELARLDLSEIAALVREDWKNVYFGAEPYLDAMATLRDIKDNYMLDSGSSIVAYFLANATTWRGEAAKAVKKELNRRLK